MNQKVIRHIEPTVDLSEMETSNMITILEIMSMKYLELLAERLDGETETSYEKAVFDMRSKNVGLDRIKEAEQIVMEIVDQFGKLVIFGDQLTVHISFFMNL